MPAYSDWRKFKSRSFQHESLAVSYTHLTLPTTLYVLILVGAETLIKQEILLLVPELNRHGPVVELEKIPPSIANHKNLYLRDL